MCDTIEVMVADPPVAAINKSLCDMIFTAGVSSGGRPPFAFLWSTGETTESIDIPADGSYTVTVTDDCGEVSSTTASTQEFVRDVVFGARADCNTDGIILTAGSSSTGGPNPVYTWSNGETGEVIVVQTEGEYAVTVTDDCGLSATFTDVVDVPDIASEAEILFETNCVEDNPSQSTVTFSVIVDDDAETNIFVTTIDTAGNMVNVPNPTSSLLLNFYNVIVTNECGEEIANLSEDFSFICGGTFSYPTVFFPAGEIEQESVFGPIPSDTMNLDRITDFEFKVYNRWGQEVYAVESDDSSAVLMPWDGTHGGDPAPSEVYIWYATYNVDGIRIESPDKGDITLVR